MDVGISLAPPLVTDAKTDIARLAGCSQLGQSAPVELMDWSFSNRWLQVGQLYSYRGKIATSQEQLRHPPEGLGMNLTEANMTRQEQDHS